jgi:tetratricopeptide (TPR) repeat protein
MIPRWFAHQSVGPLGRARLLVALAVACWAAPAWGQESGDDSDRQVRFVERTSQATELYNDGHYDAALAVFSELAREGSELDVDGYAVMGMADCLFALGRWEEARAVYAQITSAYPEQADTARERVFEIAVRGQPDDTLLEELRRAVADAAADDAVYRSKLARALQKRAAALLQEAAQVFQAASKLPDAAGCLKLEIAERQAGFLAELCEDLTSLVERTEEVWRRMDSLRELKTRDDDGSSTLLDYRAEWGVCGGGRIAIEAGQQGDWTVTLNGRPVTLNPTQARILRRHQERISQLIQAAASQPAAH